MHWNWMIFVALRKKKGGGGGGGGVRCWHMNSFILE